jgi:hypothetical protein
MSSPPPVTFITLQDAKDQLSIDAGLTLHDARITELIGAAIDWAENFCGRSLGQLLPLSGPSDGAAVVLPEPVDSPFFNSPQENMDVGVEGFNDWQYWDERTWQSYYKNNPLLQNNAATLRRDLKNAILMRVELLFDRNVDNWELLDKTATDTLFPYRTGMGV